MTLIMSNKFHFACSHKENPNYSNFKNNGDVP